jgi:ribonuclease D
MPDPVLPPPTLIAAPAQLISLVHDLEAAPVIAVDTESNSLFAYWEQVCLVQFSTPARDYIVDPLALPDLGALALLFANRGQQKIFHAAEYDLLCLKRDYGFEFANIFDTMVAARTLGWPQVGLGPILETRFGVKTNTKYQRANWGHRPLTLAQLDYARRDTRYLCGLKDQLEAELAAAGRLEEAQEEFARLTQVQPSENAPSPDGFWQIAGARDLRPAQAAVLREVYWYREQQAQHANRPPFKVMSEQTLLEIAQQCPRRVNDLCGVTGMTPGQIRRHATGLLKAVQRGQAAPPPQPPQAPSDPDEVRERYDCLRQWRKKKAQERGVESDVIVPREALREIALRAPRTLEELSQIGQLGPWRRQAYGKDILKCLDGK